MRIITDLRTADENGYLYPELVPLMSKFVDKEAYKKLGAKWDRESLLWLVASESKGPLNYSSDICSYLPDVMADNFYYAKSVQACWWCKKNTQVHCVACRFSVRVEAISNLDGDLISDIQHEFDTNWAMLSDCTVFDDETEHEIKAVFPKYRVDFNKVKNKHCYMNHCERCDSKIGDFYMHSEPGGAFFSTGMQEDERIKLHAIRRRILAKTEATYTAECLSYATVDYNGITHAPPR